MGRAMGILAGVGIALAVAGDATGQERLRPPRAYLDLDLVGADAVGEFGQRVDGGFGGQAAFRLRLTPQAPAFLRVDGGFVVYGYERIGTCYGSPYGCRIGPDVTTTNTVGYMGVGPEIAVEGAIAPYLFGTLGFSYFSTQSSLSGGDPYYDDLFDTRHFSDLVLSTRAGGGLRFRLGGPGSLLVDVGAEYHRNGVTDYLAEGDIVDNPDGSITLYPARSEANYVSFRLGISIPFGGGGAGDSHPHDEYR